MYHKYFFCSTFLLDYLLSQASLPMKAYAAQYKRFLEVLTTNTAEYVETIRQQHRDAREMRNEINYHVQMRDSIETSVPASLVIGPFLVIVANLKQQLVARKWELALALMDMHSATCRAGIEEVLGKGYVIVTTLLLMCWLRNVEATQTTHLIRF